MVADGGGQKSRSFVWQDDASHHPSASLQYPNGIRLKYENVSLTLSVGDGAKVQTAPSGNTSNTIVKAGKTTKLIFFMLCTSVYKSEFSETYFMLLNTINSSHNSS